MNTFFPNADRAPPSLAAHLRGLRDTLDDLGQRVRERISEAVSQAVSTFVHGHVRALLDRCYLQPDSVSNRENLERQYDEQGIDPYEDDFEEFRVEEEVDPAPPNASTDGLVSTGLRRFGGWLQGCRRWTGLPVLGSFLVAGAAVLGSAAGLVSLADMARTCAGLLTSIFAF